MATKKKEVEKVVKKDVPKKAVVKKVTKSTASSFTTVKKQPIEKKTGKHIKVQTAEGWKRSMIRMHKTKNA